MKMRAWQIAVVGVMAIALISTSLILVRQTQPTISDEIFYMKASIEDSVEAIKAEDPNAAKIYVSEVWSSLNKAKGLIETENESKNETKNFKTALRMYDDIYKILIRLHFLSKEAIALQNAVENVASSSEALLQLPQIEVIGRGLFESKVYLTITIVGLDLILEVHSDIAEYGLNDEFRNKVNELTPWFLNFLSNFQEKSTETLSMFPNYENLGSREIPVLKEMQAPNLEALVVDLFNLVDEDNSKTWNWEELQSFFYWIKWKIGYKSDIEENRIMQSFANPKYWETPAEMRTIVANDGDLSALYATFLNYFGVDAHIASLISNSNNAKDHFICIARISETSEEFSEKVGNMPFFEINGDEFGISSGYYVIIDPLSDIPFYLAGGESPAEFTLDGIFQP